MNMKRMITDACNNSAKRIRGKNKQKAVYWWSEGIAECRSRWGALRRRLKRAKA